MKITDAVKLLNESSGQHLEQIYIPSAEKTLMFKPLTTADIKTLTRISFLDTFDLNVEIIKLSLFDKLCTEDLAFTEKRDEEGNIVQEKVSSKTITQIDYLSFLIGLRQMLDNTLSYNITCSKIDCGHRFEHTLHLDEEFNEEIFNFKRQNFVKEFEDPKTNNIWKFELENFKMYDYLHFRYMMYKISEADSENPDILYEVRFTRPILYIKNIWLNDQLIEDWPDLSLPDKLMFYNKISPFVLFNKDNDPNSALCPFIEQNFAEEKLMKKVMEIPVICPQCKNEMTGVFTFDNFFMS